MHDIVTLGEVLVRLAIPSPARFETARHLDLQIGGAEANVAAACAARPDGGVDLGAAGQPLGRAHPASCGTRGRLRVCPHDHVAKRVGVYRVRRGAASRARPLRPAAIRRLRADARRGRLGAGAPRAAGAPHRDHAGARRVGPRPRRAGLREASTDVVRHHRFPHWPPRRRARSSNGLAAGALPSSGRARRAHLFGLRTRPARRSRRWRAWRPRRRSACSRARRARRCSTAAASFGRGCVPPCNGRSDRCGRCVRGRIPLATLSGRDPQEAVDAGTVVAALCSTQSSRSSPRTPTRCRRPDVRR